MNNLLTAAVTIRGVRPLWFHRFGPDALPLEKRERTGVAGHDPEEWRRTVMVTKQGQLYIEPTYIFGAMREGARYTTTKGKATAQKPVAATLQVLDNTILVDRYFPGWPVAGQVFDLTTAAPPPEDHDLPVYLDVRGVRNPSTGARNVRYRIACCAGWVCTFTLQWDKTVVDRNIMQAVLIDTGRLVGIGNGRSIGMGRFEIDHWEIENGS